MDPKLYHNPIIVLFLLKNFGWHIIVYIDFLAVVSTLSYQKHIDFEVRFENLVDNTVNFEVVGQVS